MPPVPIEGSMGAQVEQIIKDNRVVVFSKTTCPWCVKAKDIIRSISDVDIHTVQLDVVGKKIEPLDLNSSVNYKTGCYFLRKWFRNEELLAF